MVLIPVGVHSANRTYVRMVHSSELLSNLSPQVRRALKTLVRSSVRAEPRNRLDSVRTTVGSDTDRITTSIVPRHELQQGTAEQVLTAYRAGYLVKDIAEELGIHRQTVYRIVDRAEQPLRRSIPRMDDRLQRQACDLYLDGLSLAKISAKIGVPATTVKRALLANGVELRPR